MAGNWKILKMEPCNLPQKLTIGFLKIMKDTAGANFILCCTNSKWNKPYDICKQTLITNLPKENIVKMILHETLDGKFIISAIESIMQKN
ncbi:hypothetical protein [Sebaldella termitidis]|uniref:hypothetical protein n=1 Tax=Sebaldella termitidis TaxID=826 RepID=UPI003EB97F4B